MNDTNDDQQLRSRMITTQKLSNRRSLAVLRLVAREAGTVVMLVAGADEMPDGLSDPERAVAVAEVGHFTLMSAIDVAADPSRRAARSVWKAMTPDTGAAASIFMAHGVAWKVFWNAAIPRYLGFTDPEGFAQAQATRDSR